MPAARVPLQERPREWNWLVERGSLTERLRRTCPQGFRLRLVDQTPGGMDPDEAAGLGLPASASIVRREVRLLCGEQPWIHGCTVIPESTLAANAWLAHLAEDSLGDALFSLPGVTREPLELARVRAPSRLHRRATAGLSNAPRQLWARRSVYRIEDEPLLVCECFLPALIESAG